MTKRQYDENICKFQGDCTNISLTNSEDEGHFSWQGCNIKHTDSNLGNTVHDVSGYNPVSKEVEELGQICGECLCYIYNADLPNFITE